MPIPETDLFEIFLSETKLLKTKPEGCSIAFSAGPPSLSEAPVLYLSYPDIEIKLESVLTRISAELRAKGCCADNEIALATLGIIAETRDQAMSAVAHANRCLSTVHAAQLHLYVVNPNKPNLGGEIHIGEFSLKAFNPEKLLYWAERGGCGYPVDVRKFNGMITLQQVPIEIKIINWEKLTELGQMTKKWGDLSLISIMDVYYQAISWHYSQQIPVLLKERLLILEGGALVHIEVDAFLKSMFSYHIGLFHWSGPRGHRCWALLGHVSVIHMNFAPAEVFRSSERWLFEELGFHTLSDSKPLDAATKSYCRFLQRAHTHRLAHRKDEAFLHFIIALDLLLGLEGRSSESVCSRAAVLVHRQFDRTLEDQNNRLKKLYDRRSKYVHEGKLADHDDLEAAQNISLEVLWTLLATSSAGTFTNIDSWLKQVDFTASAIKAGRNIAESEFLSVGIPPIGHKRTPPHRVQ